MESPSRSTSQAIKANVDRDLRPSPYVIHAKVASAFALGTFVSLSMCAQFGVGLTPWSFAIQMKIMQFGMIGCMVVCGFVFAVFPLLFLRIMTRPLQFRLLVRKHPNLLLGWLIGVELSLLLASGFATALMEPLVWLTSAVATIWAGMTILDKVASLSNVSSA